MIWARGFKRMTRKVAIRARKVPVTMTGRIAKSFSNVTRKSQIRGRLSQGRRCAARLSVKRLKTKKARVKRRWAALSRKTQLVRMRRVRQRSSAKVVARHLGSQNRQKSPMKLSRKKKRKILPRKNGRRRKARLQSSRMHRYLV